MAKADKQLVGAFDLFSKSAAVVKRNAKTFAILYIVPLLFTLNSLRLRAAGVRDTASWTTDGFPGLSGLPSYAVGGIVGAGILVAIAVFVISMIIQAMLVSLQTEGAAGKTPDLKELWQAGKKYWLRLLGLSVVVGLLVLGGLILFIVPGLIMLRRYFLAPYFLIDQDLKIGDAMRKSADASKPYSGYVWSIIGVAFLLSLTSIVPVIGGLIAFILGVLYSVAPAFRYHELKNVKPATT